MLVAFADSELWLKIFLGTRGGHMVTPLNNLVPESLLELMGGEVMCCLELPLLLATPEETSEEVWLSVEK